MNLQIILLRTFFSLIAKKNIDYVLNLNALFFYTRQFEVNECNEGFVKAKSGLEWYSIVKISAKGMSKRT